MALPCFIRPFSDEDRVKADRFGAYYVAAVAQASVSHSRNLEHLSLIGILEDVFYHLKSLPALSASTGLKGFLIGPFSYKKRQNQGTAKIQSNLGALIGTAPNLQELEISASVPPPLCNQSAFCPRMPTSILSWHLDQLESLTLKNISVRSASLRTMFKKLPSTVRQVELASIYLQDGFWVDIFEAMHKSINTSCKISLQGSLMETTPASLFSHFAWVTGTRTTEDSVMSQLLDYIGKRRRDSPLRTVAAGGSINGWRRVSDDSLRYSTMFGPEDKFDSDDEFW